MSGKSDSVATKLVGQVFPGIPDFYGLMNEQCDILVDAMRALVDYAQDGREETAGKLRAVWRRGDALRERHLDMLERTSSTTALNFIGIFRAVVTLDMAIDCAKTSTGHILALGLPADRFMFEMAAENKNCAQALQRGFSKLTTNPFRAEDDARAAHKAKRNSEKIHLQALAKLGDDEETLEMRKTDRESVKAMSEIFCTLERREIYRNLAKSAKRLVWAANRLREIVSHATSYRPSSEEPMG